MRDTKRLEEIHDEIRELFVQALRRAEIAEAKLAEQQEQNAKLAERLSRVADALGKATVVIEELTRGCAAQGWETAAFAELSKAMAVVNSGLVDDDPPACEACHGTGLAARAERVKEREDELKGGGV